jgi:hypothetical protein
VTDVERPELMDALHRLAASVLAAPRDGSSSLPCIDGRPGCARR